MSSGRNMKKKKTKVKYIPNCLRRYRKARGLKQKDVAEILGIKSASMISRWENGLCLPSTMNLFRLASLYRRMTDALFIDLPVPQREHGTDAFRAHAKQTRHPHPEDRARAAQDQRGGDPGDVARPDSGG